MAYFLSSASNSTDFDPLGTESAGRSCSSVPSAGSNGKVQHDRFRSISTSSLSSVGSYFLPSLRRRAESSSTPPRSTSSINFNKIRSQLDRSNASVSNSRRTSFASSAVTGSRARSESVSTVEPNDVRLNGLVEHELDTVEKDEGNFSEALCEADEQEDDDEDTTLRLALETPIVDDASSSVHSQPSPPFRRWVSRLRRKRQRFLPVVSPRKERWTLDDFDSRPPSPLKPFHSHKKSGSQASSIRFVTAIRSATATLASASIATVSRRTGKWRRGQQRSSVISSDREVRPSMDSTRSVIDEAAKQRSRKRREKLEELIRTEESYVADVKALSDVGSWPTHALETNQLTERSYRRTSRFSETSRPQPASPDHPRRRALLKYCTCTMISWVNCIVLCRLLNTIRA